MNEVNRSMQGMIEKHCNMWEVNMKTDLILSSLLNSININYKIYNDSGHYCIVLYIKIDISTIFILIVLTK